MKVNFKFHNLSAGGMHSQTIDTHTLNREQIDFLKGDALEYQGFVDNKNFIRYEKSK